MNICKNTNQSFNLDKAAEVEALQDHCGIAAVRSPKDKKSFIKGLSGLIKLQTRGYDGAGFFAFTKTGSHLKHLGKGLIDSVFSEKIINKYKNNKAATWLFQTRYGTHGSSSEDNLQPLVRTDSYGEMFSLVHNGQFLLPENSIEDDKSDTVLFADELAASKQEKWDERILNIQRNKKGAWSIAIDTKDNLYLLRDKHGIRPFWYGSTTNKRGEKTWCAASETSALESMGVSIIKQVRPGSVLKINDHGVKNLTKSLTSNYQKPSKSSYIDMQLNSNEGIRDMALFSAKIFYELVTDLERMHELGIQHRDLRERNILIVEEAGSDDDVVDYHPKLIDFGSSSVVGNEPHTWGDLDEICKMFGYILYKSKKEGIDAENIQELEDLFATFYYSKDVKRTTSGFRKMLSSYLKKRAVKS